MWGYECRAKLLKQIPPKPTERRGTRKKPQNPSPNAYEPPTIFCGPGYGNVKRAPAYTFGHRTPLSVSKPALKGNAPMMNISGLGRNGRYKITHSFVSPQLEPIQGFIKTPGPAAYVPQAKIQYRRPPEYSCGPPAWPRYEPWDMWTPSPNMYWPPIPRKNPPAYSLGYMTRNLKPQELPGPGEHDPNYGYVKKTKPAFSFGAPFKQVKQPKYPAPNSYCHKKFAATQKSIPTPSFGIRHSKYCGQPEVYLKDSKLDVQLVAGA